jgi:hypothetical protein
VAKWFVHLELSYYPTSFLVEAETAEKAAQQALAAVDAELYGQTYSVKPAVAVVALDDVTFFGAKETFEVMCEPIRTEDDA